MSGVNANVQRPRFPVGMPLASPQTGMLNPNAALWVHNLNDLLAFGPVVTDTRANRLAAVAAASGGAGNTYQGTESSSNKPYYAVARFGRYLFYESDSTLTYLAIYGSGGWTWQYLAGIYTRTQAQLAALAATLGTSDTGLLVQVSTYNHILQWTGSAWQRGPGDPEHSDTFHMFASAPTDPGWLLCGGQAGINYLKYDGTLGTRTLPAVANWIPVAGAAYDPTGANVIQAGTGAYVFYMLLYYRK
jgi:hypothetical protein